MSDLQAHAMECERLAQLRRRAASRLSATASAKGPAVRAGDALAVLHTLASSPDTAADALTLLHELQVYQVELELQAQELRESRTELESTLRRQIELYDHMPVGCFTIDVRMVLQELNQTGADMLGTARDEAYGLPLDAFFSAESAHRFREVVSGLEAGAQQAACMLKLRPGNRTARQVLVSIGEDPAAHRFLVNLVDTGDDAGAAAK